LSEQDADTSQAESAAQEEVAAADEAASVQSLSESEPAQGAEPEVAESEDVAAIEVDDLQSATTGVEVDETMAASVTEIVEPDEVAEAGAVDAPAPGGLLPVRPAGSDSGVRVQLAAYGTEERAQAAWSELRPDLADMLGSHEPMIEEAVLASGTFYRLQIGSFGTSIEARDFCDALLARRLDCLVVPH
jgi:hypothetical protein